MPFVPAATGRSTRMGLVILLGLSACQREQPLVPVDQNPTTAVPTTNSAQVAPDPRNPEHPAEDPPSVTNRSDPHPDPDPVEVPVYRPDDDRIPHDTARLAAVGIQVFESKRLRLYTDLPADKAESLPQLIDEVYLVWEDYFGALPEDRAGRDFQISGYLMQDEALFRGLGLVPADFTFEHGAQRRNEFWMREQEFDYYRRHLLIHEATHCYMTFVPGVDASNWYLEGMAEYFAAHRQVSGSPTEFRTMPTSPEEFAGFGRISLLRKDVAANKLATIPTILALVPAQFVVPDPYAWSWGLCLFLDSHPRYHDRFQQLGAFTRGKQFSRQFEALFGGDRHDLEAEWSLFASNMQYGYDLRRAAIDFQPGILLDQESPARTVSIAADHGWQSSGVKLEQGKTYDVVALGEFTLAQASDQGKAWLSEAQGISYRYFEGKPIGTLLGALHAEPGPSQGTGTTLLNVIRLGKGCTFQAPITGTLYLRINDAWNSLHDNGGQVQVTLRERSETPE